MGISATAAAATSSSGGSTFIILIIVFIGLIYFMAIRPGRNRQKKVAQQQNNVRPGARVRTTAGMYATVVAVDGDDVVLEVAPDVEVRYMKRAIMEVVSPGDAPEEETYDAEPETYDAEPETYDAEPEDDVAAEHEEHETAGTAHEATAAHDDDLTINGQRDAAANGSTAPGVKPESTASKE
jgi:preprotein translocase subunit YajC